MGRYIDLHGLVERTAYQNDPEAQAIEEYNLGLAAKYRGEWQESFQHNLRASELRDDDEATWWNLAIAATALSDWKTARRAWVSCGIEMPSGDDEIRTPEMWACVRVQPNGNADVVWGKRLDPARILVMNIPRPETDRLYGDIILNDGAQEGTRTSGGVEYPVFDELSVWKRSAYSTYAAEVRGVGDEAKAALERLCEEHDLAYEDWGTIRMLCEQCSRGNPAEHDCSTSQSVKEQRYGFASKSIHTLEETLRVWRETEVDVFVGKIELMCAGGVA